MKVTILYDWIEDKYKAEAEARKEKLPLTYEQISAALGKRGHTVKIFPIKQASNLMSQLDKDDSDVIFNLLEAVGGETGKDYATVGILEFLGKVFTGTGTRGLALGQDKAVSKKIFAFHHINTPKFITFEAGETKWCDDLDFPLFVKPLNEDSSVGIDSKAIVTNVKELMERISYIHNEIRSAVLIEEYIEGRELYLSVMGNEKPVALPIIEWDFSSVPEGAPRIASAEAKWDDNAHAYKDTYERFPTDIPEEIYHNMQQASIQAFRALVLHDYARFDVRLREKPDTKGSRKQSDASRWEYYFIEVNPNPWLDKDAEFIRAGRKHGISYPDMLEKILEMALARARRMAKKA